jgi:hypothetical protein
MRLLPLYQETFVLPFDGQETSRRLKQVIRPLEKNVEYPEEVETKFLFNGWIKGYRFRISRKIRHPENFLPLIIGRIESTSVGSILFIRYRLFFSAALFLIFWTVISLLLGLFLLILQQEYLYAAVAFSLGIGNYVIATKNFHIQIRSSRKMLNEALKFENGEI